VARIRAGVASDPGPPPHFPALIYEPENIQKSHDICDSNPLRAFATIDTDALRADSQACLNSAAASAMEARNSGLTMRGIRSAYEGRATAS
jgi:hypothetical protein